MRMLPFVRRVRAQFLPLSCVALAALAQVGCGTGSAGGTFHDPNGNGTCEPEADAVFCGRVGRNCGPASGTDNCDAARSVASCGTCVGQIETCGGSGIANVCGEPGVPPADDNANKMGINIAAPLDYAIDHLYANAISESRDFKSGLNADGATLAPLDVQGWPTSDFSFYVWGSGNHRDGTYALSFQGQATVSGNFIGNVAVVYDANTNTSAGTFQFPSPSGNFALSFASTRRTSASALGTGVTAIKLMRPMTPGGAQTYPPSTLFTDPIKALIAKFSVVRLMDFLATNSNQQVNWSDRPLPAWPSFHRKAGADGYGWQGIGGPWEHAILLMNEVGKDAWINLPVKATDAYVLNVARLFAFGSDGVEPYTSPQANPVYPPLAANLKLYVEYSNELWNSAGAFSQSYDNCQAASDELASTSGASPLNWDGSWNGTLYNRAAPGNWNWYMCWRNIAKRGVEISNIFRSVFGDAAMMTRVRPLLMTQLGGASRVLHPATHMMLNYYDNMGGDFVATPRSPNYYFYGAGGSGYYSPAPSVASLDAFFADPSMTPAGFEPALQEDAWLVAAMGVKRVAYEGGPSLDRTGGVRDAVSAQAVEDPRMTTAMVNMHNAWSSNGGSLLMYFSSTGDYQWGFTPDVYNLATPKLLAIDALNAAERAPPTLGTLVPGSVAGNLPGTCSRGWGCNPLAAWDNFTADGSKILWASYTFRADAAAAWTVTLSFTSASSASVAVYVDGNLIGTQSTSGAALSFDAGTVGVGLHGVVVRAASGTFVLSNVAVD
ncbi:MAG: hypothetical protein AAB426_12260 [Myxococcota bacterium]